MKFPEKNATTKGREEINYLQSLIHMNILTEAIQQGD